MERLPSSTSPSPSSLSTQVPHSTTLSQPRVTSTIRLTSAGENNVRVLYGGVRVLYGGVRVLYGGVRVLYDGVRVDIVAKLLSIVISLPSL